MTSTCTNNIIDVCIVFVVSEKRIIRITFHYKNEQHKTTSDDDEYFQKCTDHRLSDKTRYPTFARTSPPAEQIAKFVISLLLHYDWRKLSLIVGRERTPSDWERIDAKLREMLPRYGIAVNGRYQYKEPYMEDLELGYCPIKRIVEQSYKTTRGEDTGRREVRIKDDER